MNESTPNTPKPGMSTGKKIALFGCAGPSFLLVLAGGCTAAVMSVAGDTDVSEEPTTEAAEDAEIETVEESDDEDGAHQLGDTFEHGNFSFTVHSVEYGVTSVIDEFEMTQEPRGEYIVVELTAENISSSAEWLEGSDQVLMDEAGSMHEYDLTASSDVLFIDQLNPGQSAEATLVYDVAEGTEISHLMVNGKDMFADGVRVNLD